MAADLAAIVAALTAFYDFTAKTLVAVGAGGGQLIAYASGARSVIAIDPDAGALQRLLSRATELGIETRLTLLQNDLLAVRPRGDVVLFEFCLHEISDPDRALEHAHTMAPEVVVIDHAPGSRWAWYGAEERGVAAGWEAVARRGVRRQKDFDALQRFTEYAELEAKMAPQGPVSRERIGAYRGQGNFSIPMPYRLALL